ncbi:hypothetical protein LCGC14_2268060 [marine sediment metagenome]|uniref:Uncharacterized protein n=1 Tax=marine sediment metagenome TaxID=412755 RepID=A0A0F9DK08_9ZZZZ
MSLFFDRKGRPMELMDWASAIESADAVIGNDTIDGQQVSTVWTGLDRRFLDGPPLIFETMIFGGPHDQYCDRYSNEEAALDGHKRTVAALRDGRDPQE